MEMQQQGNGTALPRVAYSITEVAESLGIGRSSVYELVAEGELKSFSIGRRRLIAESELQTFVARRMAAGS